MLGMLDHFTVDPYFLNQQCGDQKSCRVEKQRRRRTQHRRHQPAERPADCQHRRPRDTAEDVGVNQILTSHHAGHERRASRLEQRRKPELQHRKHVNQPQAIR